MLQRFIRSGAIAILCAFSFLALAADNSPTRLAGVARIDITPDYPVRLTGYAVRKQESEGVAQRLWAKALALGSDKEGPAILITVDNCGVPASIREEVVRRLNALRQAEPAVAAAAAPRGPRPVMEDPIVKRALELFDGKVVEVEE